MTSVEAREPKFNCVLENEAIQNEDSITGLSISVVFFLWGIFATNQFWK